MSAFRRTFPRERLRISPRKGIVDLVEMDDSMSSFRAIDTHEIDFQTVANGETSVPSLFGRPRARAIDAWRGAQSRDERNEHSSRENKTPESEWTKKCPFTLFNVYRYVFTFD